MSRERIVYDISKFCPGEGKDSKTPEWSERNGLEANQLICSRRWAMWTVRKSTARCNESSYMWSSSWLPRKDGSTSWKRFHHNDRKKKKKYPDMVKDEQGILNLINEGKEALLLVLEECWNCIFGRKRNEPSNQMDQTRIRWPNDDKFSPIIIGNLWWEPRNWKEFWSSSEAAFISKTSRIYTGSATCFPAWTERLQEQYRDKMLRRETITLLDNY